MIYLISRNYYLNYGIRLLFNTAGLDVIDQVNLTEDRFIKFTNNDIILIDISERIIEPIVRIMKLLGHPKIIVLNRDGKSRLPPFSCIYKCLDIHAPAYNILGVIQDALQEENCLPAKPMVISDKQHYIICESLKGKSVTHLAKDIGCSIKTVYAHRNCVCRKFGVKNLKELNRFAGFFTVK